LPMNLGSGYQMSWFSLNLENIWYFWNIFMFIQWRKHVKK
jgi:hypothetical protein